LTAAHIGSPPQSCTPLGLLFHAPHRLHGASRRFVGIDRAAPDRSACCTNVRALALSTVEYRTGATGVGNQCRARTRWRWRLSGSCPFSRRNAVRIGIPACRAILRWRPATEQNRGYAWAEAHLDGLGWVGRSPMARPDGCRVATGFDSTRCCADIGMSFKAQ
jgi:hypothetical protein